MVLPLMPKATAVWLIENTTLSFEQIADFCGMHALEVQGIADGEVAIGIVGKSPVESGQLAMEEIARCEKNPHERLTLASDARKYMSTRAKGSRYTPVARRQDKPDAVAWLLKTYPELTNAQIVRLIGTTKSTIDAIRTKTHWNSQNIKPKDPVMLGLCTQVDLEATVEKARKANDPEAKPKKAAKKPAAKKVAKSAAAKAPAAKKAADKKPAKAPAAKKPAAKKPAAKKPATKKAAATTAAAKKPAAKKPAAPKKAAVKKATAKAPAKTAATKKPAAKKPAAKAATKKTTKKKAG